MRHASASRPRISRGGECPSGSNGRTGGDPLMSGELDRIPQLMHELHNQRSESSDFNSSYRDHYLTERKRHGISNRAAGSPTRRDLPYDIGEWNVPSTSPPAPPPRALELVKEEVHRALEAFSARPLKGESSPPLPSDLLRPFDSSKDGRVNYRDFQSGILGLGIGLTAEEAGVLAQAVDVENTGLVDRGRFENAAIENWGRGGGKYHATSSPARLTPESETCGNVDAVSSSDTCEPSQGALCYPVGQQRQKSRPLEANDTACTRADDTGVAGGKERVPPPPPPLPPPPPTPSERPKLELQAPRAECAAKTSRVRSPPTVSFDHWQRHRNMTNRGIGSEEDETKAAAATASIARTNSSRSNGSSNSRRETPKDHGHSGKSRQSSCQMSRKHLNSLNTLRSLLQEDGIFDDMNGNHNGDHRELPVFTKSGGRERRDRRPYEREQQHCQPFREEEADFGAGRGRGRGGGGGGGGGGGANGEQRGTGKQHRVREEDGQAASDSFFAPRGGGAGSKQRRRQPGGGGTSSGKTASAAEAQDLERARAAAARAESILRLRSRGDLVGLRRAMSKADPSASGVVSQREMERVVLRRFGTGLSNDEASELAARYRKEFNGRSMVDYGRLFDSLEVKEAGIFGRAVASSSSTPSCSGRGRERGTGGWERQQQQRLSSRHGEDRRARSGGPRRGSSLVPAAAGERNRYSQRRYRRRGVPECDGVVPLEVPTEESQLVRRARAKTLALLDRHGTRSVDYVFGMIDPAHTQSVSSEGLREGLRVLGGSDPLSDVEHQALFRNISRGHDRVQYRELLDTLRTAEAAENRERTQRKLAHQAGLPTSGRGSASHWRHSDVLDWDVPPAGGRDGDPSRVGLKGGRQHKESRRQALVFERLRDSVRKIQEERNSAGPVFDMFRQHGRGYEGHGNLSSPGLSPEVNSVESVDHDRNRRTPPALSPAALRAGLYSLGVPLGDRDFDALVAATDPDNRGKVSYPNFCEALHLHRLHRDENGSGAAASVTRRPSSAPPRSTSRQSAGHFVEAIGGGNAAAAGGGAQGGGYARRRAMELAPPPDARTDLEGGVFHLNPATYGCANPNFTTTMIPVRSRNGGQAPGDYRPKRRQSRDGARTKAHKQNLLVVGGGDSSELWKETGAQAERRFRQGFGVKMRRSKSLSSCRAYGREGWDNIGTPSLRSVASPPTPSANPATAIADGDNAWTFSKNTVILTGGYGNRRGRCHTPKNSDLGFGSKRMRSQSRCDDDDDRCNRSGRRSGGGGGGTGSGLRRARSLSLGAERRYGDWARTSVQHLLRHDNWLGGRSFHPAGPSQTVGGQSSGRGKDNRVITDAKQQIAPPRSSSVGLASSRSKNHGRPVVSNTSRHPAQTRERRASPFATDADLSSVAARTRDQFSSTYPRVVEESRARESDPRGWGNTARGGGSRAGGQFSPTLRWDDSVSLPQQSGGRQGTKRGQAASPSKLK